MDLPVVKIKSGVASDADLLRYYHKCESACSEAVAEQTDLRVGVAFANRQFDRMHDANRILGAMLPDDAADIDALIDEVDAHYAAAGCRCLRWSMNPSATAAQTQPLVDALQQRGFRRTARDAMQLTQSVDLRVDVPSEVQVIPARASFRHARQALEEAANTEWHEPQLAEMIMQHLDDPRYELLLALRQGEPVARGGVLTVGDMGLIKNIHVKPSSRGTGLGRLMTLRCLEICARSLFRQILLSVRPENHAAFALYTKLGFRKFGEFVEWER